MMSRRKFEAGAGAAGVVLSVFESVVAAILLLFHGRVVLCGPLRPVPHLRPRNLATEFRAPSSRLTGVPSDGPLSPGWLLAPGARFLLPVEILSSHRPVENSATNTKQTQN